jgi:hypothetical protein
VGGPGDYLPTERLAVDSLAEHSSWVYNKAGVVIPLSAWARYNCGALYLLVRTKVSHRAVIRRNWIFQIQGYSLERQGLCIDLRHLDLTAPHFQIKIVA